MCIHIYNFIYISPSVNYFQRGWARSLPIDFGLRRGGLVYYGKICKIFWAERVEGH